MFPNDPVFLADIGLDIFMKMISVITCGPITLHHYDRVIVLDHSRRTTERYLLLYDGGLTIETESRV